MKTSGKASSAAKPKGDTAKTPSKDTSKSAKKVGDWPWSALETSTDFLNQWLERLEGCSLTRHPCCQEGIARRMEFDTTWLTFVVSL